MENKSGLTSLICAILGLLSIIAFYVLLRNYPINPYHIYIARIVFIIIMMSGITFGLLAILFGWYGIKLEPGTSMATIGGILGFFAAIGNIGSFFVILGY
ncbi:MAG: hypothetical protein ACFFBP_22095 [Promethearchaeota archaeon]